MTSRKETSEELISLREGKSKNISCRYLGNFCIYSAVLHLGKYRSADFYCNILCKYIGIEYTSQSSESAWINNLNYQIYVFISVGHVDGVMYLSIIGSSYSVPRPYLISIYTYRLTLVSVGWLILHLDIIICTYL